MTSAWGSVLETVKAALECIAILAGGGWVMYTFGSLRQINRARAEITSIEANSKKTTAEIARLEQEAKRGAVVEIDLSASSAVIPGQGGTFLNVTVSIANKGVRNTVLAYKNDPLVTYAVMPAAQGFEYTEVATARVVSGKNPKLASLRLLIRAGGTQRLSFVVPIPGPGLYFVVFSVPIADEEQKIAAEHGFERHGKWTAKKYVIAEATAA